MTSADHPPRESYPADPHSSDPYPQWDAAYVLGALSPAERREFEEHLASCADCSAAVAELAGMPGLLAQISPDDAAVLSGAALPPGGAGPQVELLDTELPESLRHPVVSTAAGRRRRVRALWVLAAVFALVATAVGVSAVRGGIPLLGAPSSARVLAFRPVVPADMVGTVEVVPVAGGTELNVECMYSNRYGTRPYDIVVRDRQGHSTAVKTWTASPDHKNTPSGRSDLPMSKIASIEIHPADSDLALLRADLR